LEINFSQDAVLMLSSMNLPDGIQRRRTAVDELNMRTIFEENDVICAEVRGFQHDGSLHLQARSQKYGKVDSRSTTLSAIIAHTIIIKIMFLCDLCGSVIRMLS
jgi:exosome complex RNA-binding protein Rrp4